MSGVTTVSVLGPATGPSPAGAAGGAPVAGGFAVLLAGVAAPVAEAPATPVPAAPAPPAASELPADAALSLLVAAPAAALTPALASGAPVPEGPWQDGDVLPTSSRRAEPVAAAPASAAFPAGAPATGPVAEAAIALPPVPSSGPEPAAPAPVGRLQAPLAPGADTPGTGRRPPQPQDAPAPAPAASGPPPAAAMAPAAVPPSAAPAAPAPAPDVPLPGAAHAAGQVLRLAQANGVSHARIQLRPAELGGIEIRLASDAAGVTATVIADNPEAARLLQDAGADLRRQLERTGVTVSALEIGTRTSHEGGDARGGQDRPDAPAWSPGGAAAADEPARPRSLHLPDGVLVDVLA